MKLKKGGYTDFQEFVKDVAQIFHNARVYNARTSQVFQDALALEVGIRRRSLLIGDSLRRGTEDASS